VRHLHIDEVDAFDMRHLHIGEVNKFLPCLKSLTSL
jgi:hypothetical protein